MIRYLLDTNIVSHIIRGDDPHIVKRLAEVHLFEVGISVVTQAEMLYGLAKRGNPDGLNQRVQAFLKNVEVLPWTNETAEAYAHLRSASESHGVSLAPLDLMIAAQAYALQRNVEQQGCCNYLVTRDRAFTNIPASVGLLTTTWSTFK